MQQNIDFGAFPDDPDADAIRSAFQKAQNNFTELNNVTTGAITTITAGQGVQVKPPSGNVLITANIACVKVHTSSLSIGRDANGGTDTTITNSVQKLVIDINPDNVFSNSFASIGNGLANLTGTLTVVANSQPNITSVGTLGNLWVGGIEVINTSGYWVGPQGGISGYSGRSGFSGESGWSGTSGISGWSGTSGIGTSGYSGVSGLGLSGYSGVSGTSTSGYSGASGIGTSGASGIGTSGVSGYSGFSGTSGVSGYSGFSGTSGVSGWSGTSGRSGYSGVSGYSGASGVSGWSGTSGVSGWSGTSGLSGAGGIGTSGYSGWSGTSGATGSAGGAFTYTQAVPASTWNITHNLGVRYVNVEVIDSTGNSYAGRYDFPTVTFVDSNNLTLVFTSAVAGFASVASGGGASGFSGYSGVSGVGISGYSGVSGYSGLSMSFVTSTNILYVAKNGNDVNDGSISKPFLTIKAALAAASSGNISVHVSPGNYTEINPITIPANVALMGDNIRNVHIQPVTPSEDLIYVSSGCYIWGITIEGYLANGFSYDPSIITTAYVSPYIQNITSYTTTGTAVFIDGSVSTQYSTKAMIVGFFTIINKNGKGIHIINSGYSQLVNIYTIACNIGIHVESGGFCTLNGSDCSIGNYGLVANGYGPLQTSGTLVSQINGTFVIDNLTSGQPQVNTIVEITGDPTYYTIDTIFPNLPSVGQSTVVIQQYYTKTPTPGTIISFFTRSSIIASAHTFEYVGAGTNPATALPQYGGIPIEANEVVATGGGVITFTSTDQKGTFKVGTGFAINQSTGTITGTYFYQSLFAQMTPFMLALGY